MRRNITLIIVLIAFTMELNAGMLCNIAFMNEIDFKASLDPNHQAWEKGIHDSVTDILKARSKLRADAHLYIQTNHKLAHPLDGFAKQDEIIVEVAICDNDERLIDLLWFNPNTTRLLMLTPPSEP